MTLLRDGLAGEAGNEAHEAGAGAVRQAELDLRNLHAARHDVDDAAEAAFHHAVDAEPHHLDVAQHHGVERGYPVVARPGAEIAGHGTVGVVHENVRRRAGLERGRAAFRRRDIARDGRDRHAGCRADFVGRALDRVAGAGDDRDIDALFGERERACPAEPAARPAQQRLLALDTELHRDRQAATAVSGFTL